LRHKLPGQFESQRFIPSIKRENGISLVQLGRNSHDRIKQRVMGAAFGGVEIGEGRCDCFVSNGRNEQALRVDHLHDLCGNFGQFQPALDKGSGLGDHGGRVEEAGLAVDQGSENAFGVLAMHIGTMQQGDESIAIDDDGYSFVSHK